ncbi:MAG: thiamine phosphate synthase [Sphaerochaetaceae bacterium]|nr:thiamine phosphate synthase [Sphaerochaetaceae bacterium]MDC7237160.1 thiamine phosphate synthase [Sphaerochaetaceae bacterium]
MKFSKDQLKLYAITDRQWLKDNQSIYDIVEQALEGGATMIQVREKTLDKNSFIKEVKSILPLCHRYGVPLIVNDDIQVALESKADGIHLGQSDLNSNNINKVVPQSMILGISAQNINQALKAEKMGASYLGVGAVFTTDTKRDASVLNPFILKEIAQSVNIATVAIGGINNNNIKLLENTSIAGISLISAIFAQDNIQQATSDILSIIKRTKF